MAKWDEVVKGGGISRRQRRRRNEGGGSSVGCGEEGGNGLRNCGGKGEVCRANMMCWRVSSVAHSICCRLGCAQGGSRPGRSGSPQQTQLYKPLRWHGNKLPLRSRVEVRCCVQVRHGLSKQLYSAMFAWMVNHINQSLAPESSNTRQQNSDGCADAAPLSSLLFPLSLLLPPSFLFPPPSLPASIPPSLPSPSSLVPSPYSWSSVHQCPSSKATPSSYN